MECIESHCESISWMSILEMDARKPFGVALPPTGKGAKRTAVIIVDKSNRRLVIMIRSFSETLFVQE